MSLRHPKKKNKKNVEVELVYLNPPTKKVDTLKSLWFR